MPGDVELEVAIDECFRRIDSDRSNSLTLGELLVFAYRNRRLERGEGLIAERRAARDVRDRAGGRRPHL